MSDGANVRIDAIEARYLQFPLTRPYRLAFGPVTHYDTILVEIIADDGRRGFGEATLLTGYTDETIADAWAVTKQLARSLCGATAKDARARLGALAARAPFTATAFATSLDMLEGHPLLTRERAVRVPILGLLQGADEAELADGFAALLDQGYRTVKIKVGFDVDDDLAFVASVQKVVAGRAAIRVDANQGYTADEAAAFVAGVDPAGIELFEQPCAAGDWTAHRAAVETAARTGLPLMLDESIYGLDDIERAAREDACAFLKVKLMKFVCLDRLAAAIARIRALGKRPVLGNGVACDLSCWMEACVAAEHIDNAGEMNGFLKARRMLFATPLAFDRGAIVLEPGPPPSLDRAAIEAHARDHVHFHRARHPCAAPPSSPA